MSKFALYPRVQPADHTKVPKRRTNDEVEKTFGRILSIPGFHRKLQKYSKFYPRGIPGIPSTPPAAIPFMNIAKDGSVESMTEEEKKKKMEEDERQEIEREDAVLKALKDAPPAPDCVKNADVGDVVLHFFGTSASTPTNTRNGTRDFFFFS